MKKLLLATMLLILTGCGTTYYEKFQQECKQYKVIKKLKSKTSKKIYLEFENGSIHEVSPIMKYEDIEENHKLKKCDF
jgi:cell division protein ftsA|uniref:TRAF PROTEIN, TRAO PROTEIN, TRAN ADHESION, BACTERIAL SECRETION.5A n=1 Tax=Siphoviridae sp. cttKr9 TaxID=2825706 RepID=A0A8S5V3S0_9CAUD|nr:MAG TPA: TRAF PROTEIN, TRAO PROTEIN, TRAN ADHESION, BACTERIAL SECRETION.5A [Siphoviridae sp. cttKr9]